MAQEYPEAKKFDLNDLYARAFGQVAFPYPLVGFNVALGGIKGAVESIRDTFKVKSMLKESYYMPLRLARYSFPTEPIISARGGKDLVITKLNRGRRAGSVIEEDNLENIEFTVRGFIVNEDEEEYPEDDVREFMKLMKRPGSLQIFCALSELLGVTNVVVQSWRLPNFESGYCNVQAYEFVLVEDVDYDLETIPEDQT